MKIVETEAIVLKSYALAEADKIVLLLTRQHGLTRVTVRGAKRLKNRFGGRLELFTVANVVYGQKEDAELGRLLNAETVESYFHLAARLNVLNALSYQSELLSALTPMHEPQEVLYRMTKTCLQAIAAVKDDLPAVRLAVSYFEIWLLRLAGFLPDFQTCGGCRTTLAGKTVYYQPLEAQLRCQACAGGGRAGDVLEPALQKCLRAALVQPPLKFVETARRLEVGRDEFDRVTHRLLRRIIEFDPAYWTRDFELENGAPAVEPLSTAA